MVNEKQKKERKITKFSLLSIFFALILLIGAIFGIGLSIKKIGKNTHESSEFTNSINYRMRVALTKNENDKIDDFEDAKLAINNAASSLSLFLKDTGQSNYDVQYELYKDSQDEYYGYLNANLNIKKVKNHLKYEEEKFIDDDPYLTFFNLIHNADKTLIYK